MPAGDVLAALTEAFGPGFPVRDAATPEISTAWTIGQVEVALASGDAAPNRLASLWKKRKGDRATPVLIVARGRTDGVRVLGPRAEDRTVRTVSEDALVRLLRDAEPKPRREAVPSLSAALERLDQAGIPGVRVRGLLTNHLLAKRLKRDHPADWERLKEEAANLGAGRSWLENLTALGYQVQPRPSRGYLLSRDGSPLAVVHPFPDPAAFSRLTDQGAPPEGLLVADCNAERVEWGLLATDKRFRLFPAKTSVGAATARYVEFDLDSAGPGEWPYLALLAPHALEPGGLLDRLVEEARLHGNRLRETVEIQIRDDVIPAIARGLAAQDRADGVDLSSPTPRKLMEDAALLLMFRLLFFLYLEGRGYLPVSSAAYRPHSATTLLQEARAQSPEFGERETTLWDRFETLVHAMRTGSKAWGLPAYNGDLFAAGALEGAERLEMARLPDAAFGPALAALGADPDGAESEEAGVDFGDLEIAHLGRIYEGLLSLRLSLATEPMAYDAKAERWTPAGKGVEPEVPAGEVFYQSESGGRKAAGVYYTPQVIVRHLVDHSVRPALEEHLARVAQVADRDAQGATALLFDFKVLDPAMGSAHFLADALDVIADHIATFLGERPLRPVVKLLDELRAETHWEGRIEDGDLLRRLVLKRCIYGVDLSGMAVEMAKVSLWLASFVPGLSLAYLGHNLRQGDSLVGVADVAVLSDTLGPFAADYEDAPIPRTLRKARAIAGRIAETADRTPG